MDAVHDYSEYIIADQMRWLIGEVAVDGARDRVEIGGWIASLGDDFEGFTILFNSSPAQSAELWQSPELGEFFPALGNDRLRRFRAAHSLQPLRSADGVLQFSLVSKLGETPRTYRSSWFYPVDEDAAMPAAHRMERVIATGSRQMYLLGGWTTVKRFDLYLRERFGRGIGDFERVLDWGSGAARLTRRLLALNPNTWGADIDADNVEWCNANIAEGRFRTLDLNPPSPFADGEFDLITGVSVFTHLAEQDQFRWLAELARITRPGGIVLMSVRGFTAFALEKHAPHISGQLCRDHFVVLGANNALQGVVANETYYTDALHTPDYIYANWSRYFEIIDIVPVLAGPQELVVMRKR